MNKKLDKHHTNHHSKSDRKRFPGLRPWAGFWITYLLFVTAIMLLASGPARAQGAGTNPRTPTQKAQPKVVEGATITAKQITLKSGYTATRINASTIAVRKKNGGGTTVTVMCTCVKGTYYGTECSVTYTKVRVFCGAVSCGDCQWKDVKR